MISDIKIAQQADLKPIAKIAQILGIKEYESYGKFKAKIAPTNLKKDSKLILVTATSPTPFGEGKTTTSVGLADAINRLGKSVCMALREPSLGPVFGIKGGAAGGGYSQLAPMLDLNLHFTGDFAAISAANNLIAAMIDNAIYWKLAPRIDKNRVLFSRAIDMNDRALRNISLNFKNYSIQSSFCITAASELMAILCLSADMADLKARLGRMLVAYDEAGDAIYLSMLGCVDAVAILLKDALKPNLIQSLEGTPALIHGGPFANIAHGCNSIIATKTALGLADYVVSEAGFGSDLGAEKFLDIKCQLSGLRPSAAVLVSTIRSLKHNGYGLLENGVLNLKAHIQNLKNFGLNPIVALNKFAQDLDDEIEFVKGYCQSLGVKMAVCENYAKGSSGALELATLVLDECKSQKELSFCYSPGLEFKDKLARVASRVYGASGVLYSEAALAKLDEIKRLGLNLYPCVAKTQYSFSDDAKKLGWAKGCELNVRDIEIRSGAGFGVVVSGDMMLMPGLSKHPAALDMRISDDGQISGLS